MKEKIQETLRVLIGLPLIKADRALDMEMFDFGKRQTIVTRKGNEKEVGEYALHVQSAWRILGPQGIVVASRDRYYPADDSVNIPDDFDWSLPGNRCDKRVTALLEDHPNNLLVVKSVEADNVGSLQLTLTGGYVLDIFPDSSLDAKHSEHWRFFRMEETATHFVITGHGIEE